jgi:hypothetical protein
MATNSDPAFLRILAKSERYNVHDDAPKQRVPRVERCEWKYDDLQLYGEWG